MRQTVVALVFTALSSVANSQQLTDVPDISAMPLKERLVYLQKVRAMTQTDWDRVGTQVRCGHMKNTSSIVNDLRVTAAQRYLEAGMAVRSHPDLSDPERQRAMSALSSMKESRPELLREALSSLETYPAGARESLAAAFRARDTSIPMGEVAASTTQSYAKHCQ